MGLLMVNKVSCYILEIEILLKIIEGLYGISPIACHADCIFLEWIPYYQAFSIKEKKSALSRLYIINRIFSANNVL